MLSFNHDVQGEKDYLKANCMQKVSSSGYFFRSMVAAHLS